MDKVPLLTFYHNTTPVIQGDSKLHVTHLMSCKLKPKISFQLSNIKSQ